MSKVTTVVFFLISFTFAQEYMESVSRYGGLLEDLKFTGQNNKSYFFIAYTDKGRIYTITSNHVPYFGIGDSVIEYWNQYKLSGIGKRGRVFYYQVVKSN